jgi:hypothetical protein
MKARLIVALLAAFGTASPGMVLGGTTGRIAGVVRDAGGAGSRRDGFHHEPIGNRYGPASAPTPSS